MSSKGQLPVKKRVPLYLLTMSKIIYDPKMPYESNSSNENSDSEFGPAVV